MESPSSILLWLRDFQHFHIRTNRDDGELRARSIILTNLNHESYATIPFIINASLSDDSPIEQMARLDRRYDGWSSRKYNTS
jgi:hypothetical protein